MVANYLPIPDGHIVECKKCKERGSFIGFMNRISICRKCKGREESSMYHPNVESKREKIYKVLHIASIVVVLFLYGNGYI